MQFEPNSPATPRSVEALRSIFPALPEDYFAFLSKADGGEGFVQLDEEFYFQLFSADEVARFTQEYELPTYLPGYVAVGSNGGGELYVFSSRGQPSGLYMVPAIGMEESCLRLVVGTFQGITLAMAQHAPQADAPSARGLS